MIRVEDISWDAVRLTMVGRLERPEGVTVQEWLSFWNNTKEAQENDLMAEIESLTYENDRLKDRLEDY